MSDPRVNISTVFDPYDSTQTAGAEDTIGDGVPDHFYLKDCEDNTCADLHIFKGSDGDSYPPASTLFIDGDAFTAAARCYLTQ